MEVQKLFTPSKIEDRFLIIKAMKLNFRVFVSDNENLYILQFPGHAITLSQQVLGSALIVRLYLTVSYF